MIWFSSLALAAPPNQQADLIAIPDGSGVVDSLIVSHPYEDEPSQILVGVDRGVPAAFVLDLDTWAITTLDTPSDCGVTGVTAFDLENGTSQIWISCSSGDVEGREYASDGSVTTLAGPTELAPSLTAVFYDGYSISSAGRFVYALSLPGGGQNAQIHVFDPVTLATDAQLLANYPMLLTATGYEEGWVVPTAGQGALVVSHGSGAMSTLQLALPAAVAIPEQPAFPVDCDDMAPSPFIGEVFCLDQETFDDTSVGQVFAYRTQTNQFAPILGLDGITGPRAVGVSDDLSDNWIAVTGEQVQVWELDEYGVLVNPANPAFETEPSNDNNPIQDIVATESYLFGGGTEGRLHIVTDRPWVDRDSVILTPGRVIPGEQVTLTFSVPGDDVDWEVREGGDRTGAGGVLLEESDGPVKAGETIEVTIPVSVEAAEGPRDLFVLVTDSAGEVGHASATYTVDDIPTAPNLRQSGVGFGDRRVTLEFEGISDEDLSLYRVYVSTEPFTPDDEWPNEQSGPDYRGDTNLVAPFDVEAEPGEQQQIAIFPLRNGVTHYIAVRAVDQGGKESEMKRVVEGVPERGQTLSERTNEPGGAPCATGVRAASGGAMLGLIGAGLLFRRRQGALLALGLAIGGLGLASPAQAQDDDGYSRQSVWQRKDSTPVRANLELRYGVHSLADEDAAALYDESVVDSFTIEVGPQIFRFVEIDLGVGLIRENSFTVRPGSLIQSNDGMRLTVFPAYLDISARAHVFDEQPVVPFFRFGFDYAFWNESVETPNGERRNAARGAKAGSHYGAGLNLLIDTLSPNRASLLEAQTGINDTWLTLEWRRNRIDARNRPWQAAVDQGFTLSGDVFSVGLKLDY
ncbi:MAG: hypothetical protein AAGA48_29395 [Myxococcota bacterium]